jgi:hypothetical protein
VDNRGDKSLMGLTVSTTHDLLDGLLVERKIQSSLVRVGIINHSSLRPTMKKKNELEKEKKEEESKKVEEI